MMRALLLIFTAMLMLSGCASTSRTDPAMRMNSEECTRSDEHRSSVASCENILEDRTPAYPIRESMGGGV